MGENGQAAPNGLAEEAMSLKRPEKMTLTSNFASEAYLSIYEVY